MPGTQAMFSRRAGMYRPMRQSGCDAESVLLERPALRRLRTVAIHALRSFIEILNEHRDVAALVDGLHKPLFFVRFRDAQDLTARNVSNVHACWRAIDAENWKPQSIAHHCGTV
jgi:hypothetical protein